MIASACSEWAVCRSVSTNNLFGQGMKFVFSFSKLQYVFIVHQDLLLKRKPFFLWCDPFNVNTSWLCWTVSQILLFPSLKALSFLSLSLGHLSQSAVSGLWLSVSRRSVPRQGGQNTPGSASLQLCEGGNCLCDCLQSPVSHSYFLDSWSDSLRALGDI